MSESTEPDFNLELHFLPSWARQPSDANRYSNYEGERERGRDSGGRRPRRDQGRAGARPPRGPGDGNRPPRRGSRDAHKGPRREGRGGKPPGRDSKAFQPAPLPELNVSIVPDDHGVDSLTKQIRMTGRAYPLFEIARMILQKPERHSFSITVRKQEDGQPKEPLFQCAIDGTVWLSEDAAVNHILHKHFDMFYQAERTEIEPPKGTYTFVAQCGMSGVILGPPNYHDYQKNLRDLHARRFSRMDFEAFKSRVKIVKDEEVVKKWLEEKSYTTEYNCLNLPEPLKLSSREEVEKHFRDTHLPNVVSSIEKVQIKGSDLKDIRVPALARLLRITLDDQRRFPLQVVTVLSQQFASRGLQFFKVNKSVTHVSVARPHFLDLDTTPVSDNIKRIVKFIDGHPGTSRKELIDSLAPMSAAPAPATETQVPKEPTAAQGESPAPPAADTLPPEVAAIITDLHWLVHEGHVIEFATGTLETAKKPNPKPPKASKPKEAIPAKPAPSSDSSKSDGETAAQNPDAPSAQPDAENTPSNAQAQTEANVPPSAGVATDQENKHLPAEEPSNASPQPGETKLNPQDGNNAVKVPPPESPPASTSSAAPEAPASPSEAEESSSPEADRP